MAQMIAGEGFDIVSGNEGSDSIMGGPGDDTIFGNHGSDNIDGQDSNDKIYHNIFNSTAPDSSQDVINCGDGMDETWINIKIDKDTASSDCEIVHKD
jgi:Ca2+-binding RTX toxin-like protein